MLGSEYRGGGGAASAIGLRYAVKEIGLFSPFPLERLPVFTKFNVAPVSHPVKRALLRLRTNAQKHAFLTGYGGHQFTLLLNLFLWAPKIHQIAGIGRIPSG